MMASEFIGGPFDGERRALPETPWRLNFLVMTAPAYRPDTSDGTIPFETVVYEKRAGGYYYEFIGYR